MVETNECGGSCVRTIFVPDDDRPVDTVAAFSLDPIFVDEEACSGFDDELALASDTPPVVPATIEVEAATGR